MKPIDHNYLKLQFWDKIFKKNATEFQSFFEDIMEKAFSDFEKIRPYGNQGDGGNDGYRPSEGIYYQVYSPINPEKRESDVIKKLRTDFNKLKENWNHISNIKKFYFVFNDKNTGVTKGIKEVLSELKCENPTIEFEIFIPRLLEEVFFGLHKNDILSLGFDIDSTKAIANANEYLNELNVELDKENGRFVSKSLDIIKNIIADLKDEKLDLEYELLECRTIRNLEKVKDAKEKYLNISKRFPDDPRAFLCLAEIYLNDEDLTNNQKLLNKAEEIQKDHWLLTLEKIIRKIRLSEKFDTSLINESEFPDDPKIKSNFYRLYSIVLERAGEKIRADSFIEKAIHLNPNRVSNYDVKLSILAERAFSEKSNKENFIKDVANYLIEIEDVERELTKWGEISIRNQAVFNIRKIHIYFVQENFLEIENLVKESFDLLQQCSFDYLIDRTLADLLTFITLPQIEFEKLLKYISNSEKQFSDELSKGIAFQFNLKNTLCTEGKKFFESAKKESFITFIVALENKSYDDAWMFLKEDFRFAVAMANTSKELPELRKKIIENLPNDENIQKDKLMLLLNYDQGNIEESFDLIKGFDLSNISYFECEPILKIAKEKKAWEYVAKVLEKLLEYEKDIRKVLEIKLELFTANYQLKRFFDVIQIGEQILANDDEIAILDEHNKEILLGQTIFARMNRGEHAEAKTLLETHSSLSRSYEFKLGIKKEVYLRNNDIQQALASVVTGIKIIKNPTPEQYGNLYLFFVEIGNRIDFSITSLEKVEDNCFVKIKERERWYYVGDDNELGATKISSTRGKYHVFIDKKIGDIVEFSGKSEKTEHSIENILTIEKYVLWQCRYNAHILTEERDWESMEKIKVPTSEESIDITNLVAYFEDDRKKRSEFYNLYCKENIPLAFLAVNTGGLARAVACVINENKGFINFSSGIPEEINQQKEVAKKVIEGKTFYLDGTSAMVLSETGLLVKIFKHLPNLKVPQSVITMLFEIKDRFRYIPGNVGNLSYAQGKLIFSQVNQNKYEIIHNNFEKCIKLLESKRENVEVISAVLKSDCSSEKLVPAELSDACILSQKNNAYVLTDDYLYLKVNEHQTRKKAPEYFSAFALIRVLYEQKKISFDEYLDFFTYLSSYRFRFLPITTDDIENAVFGDGLIKSLQPHRIRQFNFQLTLSEQYGVPFGTAFDVVCRFMIRILIDDSILPDMTERIFAEILSTFPTNKGKRELGEMFVRVCMQAINRTSKTIIIGINVQNKIDLLFQFIEFYGSEDFSL